MPDLLYVRRLRIALSSWRIGGELDTLLDVMQVLHEKMQMLVSFVDRHQTGVITSMLIWMVFTTIFRRRR